MSAVIGVRLGNSLLLIDEISGAHDTDAWHKNYADDFPTTASWPTRTHQARHDLRIPAAPMSRSLSPMGSAISRRNRILRP